MIYNYAKNTKYYPLVSVTDLIYAPLFLTYDNSNIKGYYLASNNPGHFTVCSNNERYAFPGAEIKCPTCKHYLTTVTKNKYICDYCN